MFLMDYFGDEIEEAEARGQVLSGKLNEAAIGRLFVMN
jgi:hypothetical protein